MAAVTAALNPLKPSEILLFYCASDQNVNLKRLTPSSDGPAASPKMEDVEDEDVDIAIGRFGHGMPIRGTNPIQVTDPTTGLVKNPSCFGWVNWKKLVSFFSFLFLISAHRS
jgi:hypothetical protein